MHFRIIGGLAIMITVVLGCAMYLDISSHRTHVRAEILTSTNMLADAVYNGMYHPMSTGNSDIIWQQMANFKQNTKNVEVFVLGFDKHITYASEKEKAGSTLKKLITSDDLESDFDRMMVDGKEFAGKVLPAKKAREIYEGYIRRNQDPALLEWMGAGMVKTSVFPVPPGATRTVTLHFSQLLRKTDKLTDFLFPLSTAKYTSQPVEKVAIRATIETSTKLKRPL